MIEYLFLFIIGLVWISFAVVQDLRTREIANWLNFSLVAFALFYRVFYSIYSNDWNFFLFGLAGYLIFLAIGFIFYYGRIFAGGDAKLLFGVGAILPYERLFDLGYNGFVFIFLLLFSGMIYTSIWIIYLGFANSQKFKKSFKKFFKKRLFYSFLILSVLFSIVFYFIGYGLNAFYLVGISLFLLLYFASKAIEDSCMIKRLESSKLTEGDWLQEDVKVGKTLIKKKVSGLSIEEIKLLRKYNKSVLIKEGIPFSPAFLIAFILFWLRYSSF